MNDQATEQAGTGLPATIGRLCRRDVVFVPAVFVALIGTVGAVTQPPAWVKRMPAAVSDLVSGERDDLNDRLSKAEASVASDQSTIEGQRARLAELTDSASRRRFECTCPPIHRPSQVAMANT